MVYGFGMIYIFDEINLSGLLNSLTNSKLTVKLATMHSFQVAMTRGSHVSS